MVDTITLHTCRPDMVTTMGPSNIEFDNRIATISEFLTDVLNTRLPGNEAEILVPISANTLSKVVHWMTRHFDENTPTPLSPPPPTANDIDRDISIDQWDLEFLRSLSHMELCKIVRAVFWLRAPILMDIGCRYIARLIQDNPDPRIVEGFENYPYPEDMAMKHLFPLVPI